MKKIFAILALLAFLMVPAASMAMVQTSDADLATITGAGVSIDISTLTIGMSLDSISWGDYNVTGFSASGTTYNQGGSINIIPFPGTMHVVVLGQSGLDLVVNINVGTIGGTIYTTTNPQTGLPVNVLKGGDATAIQLGFANGINVTLDGFVADIVLDSTCAAYNDWNYKQYGAASGTTLYKYGAGLLFVDGTTGAQITGANASPLAAKTLGTFGFAGLTLDIAPFNVTISAH